MIRECFEAAGFIYHSRVTIWKDPVVEMQRTKALGLLHKQVKKDAAMSRVGLPDYLLVFRKPGEHQHPVKCNIPVDLWQKYASPVWYDIDYSNTLNGREGRGEKDEKHICPLQSFSLHQAGTDEDGRLYLFDSGGFLMDRAAVARIAKCCASYLETINDSDIEDYNRWLLAQRAQVAEKMPEVQPKQTLIYLMANVRNGCYKIGRSTQPEYRERTLQAQEPHIVLIHCFPGTSATEKLLHEKFKSKRVRGEWFDLTFEDVEFIKSLESL
jgi:hypothetical protein